MHPILENALGKTFIQQTLKQKASETTSAAQQVEVKTVKQPTAPIEQKPYVLDVSTARIDMPALTPTLEQQQVVFHGLASEVTEKEKVESTPVKIIVPEDTSLKKTADVKSSLPSNDPVKAPPIPALNTSTDTEQPGAEIKSTPAATLSGNGFFACHPHIKKICYFAKLLETISKNDQYWVGKETERTTMQELCLKNIAELTSSAHAPRSGI